jgi:hypothetical protein
MDRVAVLACMTLLAGACSTEITPGGDGGELEEMAIGVVPANGIMFFPASLSAFKSHPLNTSTFDPGTGPSELTGLPNDAETRKFVKYAVECALLPEQEVKYQGEVFHGLLAECPSWNKKKPSIACLEAVTGCLLARQNPAGLRIKFSPRGERAEGGSLDPFQFVLADTYDSDPSGGLPIRSFHEPCAPGDDGEGRNCGWTAETSFTGMCEPGAPVSLGAGVDTSCNPLGSHVDGDPVMRVCEGMSGCDKGSAQDLGSSDNVCSGRTPALDITCPASGVISVMLSDYKAGAAFLAEVGASSPAPVAFPAKENELFPFLEGSFYGNMFHKINPNFQLVPLGQGEGFIFQLKRGDKKHTGLGSPQALPFEDAFCCHDPGFDPAAFNDQRVCAKAPVLDEGGNLTEQNICHCKPMGVCNTVRKGSKLNLCAIYDQNPMVGDDDHDLCRDVALVQRVLPMTTFLRSPCDMLGGGQDGKDPDGKPTGGPACGQK